MYKYKPNQEETKLVLVATPIGNISDISKRAIETLEKADIIFCEDTRHSQELLTRLNIKNKKLIPLYSQTEFEQSKKVVSLIKESNNANLLYAYISDAGTPGISDPGSILVKTCLENNIAVSFVPGATSSISALIMSGFDTSRFSFFGFLSPKPSHLKEYLEQLIDRNETLIFFETSNRLISFLETAYSVFSDRNICIARELTKLHEEYIHGTFSEILASDLDYIKGELVIVIEGNKSNKEKDKSFSLLDNLTLLIQNMLKENISKKTIKEILLNTYKVLNKNDLYKLIQSLDK